MGDRRGGASIRFDNGDGQTLHARVWEGPVDAALSIVCLPGLTRNGRDFDDLAQHLSQHFHVLCLDFRGRGESDHAADFHDYVPLNYVRDMLALYAARGLDKAVLVGTSMGGLVATMFAALHPDKVVGVVLNDVGPEPDPAGVARIASYVGNRAPVVTWDDAANAVAAIDTATYPDFGPVQWAKLARQRYAEGADGVVRLAHDQAIAQALALPESNPDQWPYFAKLRAMPLLVLRGAVSDILSPRIVARMREAKPDLTYVEVPGRGHVPMLDEPEALAAIDAFLVGLAARA